jgi:hypothetical protein
MTRPSGERPAGGARHDRGAFAFGGVGRDASQPCAVVGFADAQVQQQPAVGVALRPRRATVVEGDRHGRAQHEIVDRFAACGEQRPQAARDRGQQDVVDRGVVGVRGGLDPGEVAADQGHVPVAADGPMVEAGAGGRDAGHGRAQCADVVDRAGPRRPRVGGG